MSDSSKMGDGGRSVHKARQGRRLSAALRENLKRRKAQAKGRSAVQAAPERPAEPHDSAGIVDDKANH
jgi:hypothetical protein